MRSKFYKITSLLLIFTLMLQCSSCGKATATTIKLVKTEGDVNVNNSKEKSVKLMDDMFLYNGYNVGTQEKSYAWINLDSKRMAKMDQNSSISVEKNGDKMDIDVKDGNLYFNIEKPLAENEELNIRTSTMSVGIRGTSGWVMQSENVSSIALLNGSVETTLAETNETISIEPMEQLVVTIEDDNINYEILPVTSIPNFIEQELLDMGPVTTEDILKVMKDYEITSEWIEEIGDVTLETIIGKNSINAIVPKNAYSENNENKVVASYGYPQLNISALYFDIHALNQVIPINNFVEIGDYKVYSNKTIDGYNSITYEIYIAKKDALPDELDLIPSIHIFFIVQIADIENGREVKEEVIDEIFQMEYDKIIEQLQ